MILPKDHITLYVVDISQFQMTRIPKTIIKSTGPSKLKIFKLRMFASKRFLSSNRSLNSLERNDISPELSHK